MPPSCFLPHKRWCTETCRRWCPSHTHRRTATYRRITAIGTCRAVRVAAVDESRTCRPDAFTHALLVAFGALLAVARVVETLHKVGPLDPPLDPGLEDPAPEDPVAPTSTEPPASPESLTATAIAPFAEPPPPLLVVAERRTPPRPLLEPRAASRKATETTLEIQQIQVTRDRFMTISRLNPPK